MATPFFNGLGAAMKGDWQAQEKKKTGIRKGISFDRGGDKKWEKWGRETARIPPARKFHRFTAAAVVVAGGGGGGAKVFIN